MIFKKPLRALLPLLFLPIFGFSQSSDLAGLVESYMNEVEDFSGVVMVAYQGKPLLMEGYGMINPESDIQIDANTLFDIGSISKSFTATAILILSEQGKLSVSDPLSLYFPSLSAEKGALTLHQLLTHSSGLPGALGDDYEPISREAFLELVDSATLGFPAGTSYDYSNVGYSLLAMIIEDLSGESYDTFLQEEVLFRAKMLMTGYSPRGVEYMAVASGIAPDGSDWGTPLDKTWDGKQPYWHLRGNGGLMSSASDMFRLYLAMRSGQLLGGEATKAQFTPHVDEGGGYSFYGYGWVIMDEGDLISHNGGNGIFRADFHWLPNDDYVLFAASNNAKVPLFQISEDLLQIIRTGKPAVKLDLQEIDMKTFPATDRQKAAQRFFDNIANPDSAKAKAFLESDFSAGVIERNGATRLIEIFGMIHADNPNLKLTAVREDDSHIQLAATAEGGATIKFLIKFLEDQIDGLEIEAN